MSASAGERARERARAEPWYVSAWTVLTLLAIVMDVAFDAPWPWGFAAFPLCLAASAALRADRVVWQSALLVGWAVFVAVHQWVRGELVHSLVISAVSGVLLALVLGLRARPARPARHVAAVVPRVEPPRVDPESLDFCREELVGRRVSDIEPSIGTMLTFSFEDTPVRLWLYMCAWNVSRTDRMLGASEDDRDTFLLRLGPLVGVTLEGMDADRSNNLTLRFSGDLVLQALAITSDADPWLLFKPDAWFLSAKPDGRFVREQLSPDS